MTLGLQGTIEQTGSKMFKKFSGEEQLSRIHHQLIEGVLITKICGI